MRTRNDLIALVLGIGCGILNFWFGWDWFLDITVEACSVLGFITHFTMVVFGADLVLHCATSIYNEVTDKEVDWTEIP